MNIQLRTPVLWLFLLLLGSCIDPFQPEVVERPNNYLVVDGYINSGGELTTFRLSRTQNLTEKGEPAAESGATVVVEEEGGAGYALPELTAGVYAARLQSLNPERQYRLYIKTTNGREYASDFVPATPTPQIDEVAWQAESDGLLITVSTHDDQNNTGYYRWEYEETWEFTAAEKATVEIVNGQVRDITPESENIYTCWRTEPSTTIRLGTTTKNASDILRNFPVHKIASDSDKLRIGYSILVRQFAQTRAAYEYWENLKRNTEDIGSLFDPLPSQLTGNIQSLSEPDELVIGFVSANSATEKRMFVSKSELPKNWQAPRLLCVADSTNLPVNGAVEKMKNEKYYVLKKRILGEGNVLLGYQAKFRGCVDCREYGTNVRPEFWPQ
ncbi:DUF4249 domain-containing protein [Pontibacter beigongshangensis]|uniref:DUF4249 domain-containing protein n=1 Tax=Pontibacter beigongshangensis TaxID=2574733 RepID=UPI00164F2F31|nr:DUF4249 domain-containing protein [Pontibacter beigongshangensis]